MTEPTRSITPSGPWLTRQEAAVRLRVSPATVDRYVREGKLRRRSPEGVRARFHVEDVDEFRGEDR